MTRQQQTLQNALAKLQAKQPLKKKSEKWKRGLTPEQALERHNENRARNASVTVARNIKRTKKGSYQVHISRRGEMFYSKGLASLNQAILIRDIEEARRPCLPKGGNNQAGKNGSTHKK